MRMNDQIAVLCNVAGKLLDLCPQASPKALAEEFNSCSKRIAGVAAWLGGQAELLKAGERCPTCRGHGYVGEGTTCLDCGGEGLVLRQEPDRQRTQAQGDQSGK